MNYDAVLSETIGLRGADDDLVEAYTARPLRPGPRGGVMMIHHMAGYDRESKEAVRRIAEMGYDTICVNLYHRDAPGASAADAAAASRGRRGVPDDRLIGDLRGAARWLRDLPTSNGKVGCIGFCSGGRQAVMASMEIDLQAVVDCYGAFIVAEPPADFPVDVTPLAQRLGEVGAPILAMSGNNDTHPSPQQISEFEKLLRDNGKDIVVQLYDNAGHAFMSTDRSFYCVEAAVDAWRQAESFFGDKLS
ncbi:MULTISPECIES: dienelactone hydrolase family protein [unclassified Gordonia (in: high G+C Gram-positive bacteria)]|uniref:dienelactone hydrolase family protein n=1 Tax=unclassified Gordonia (in: high G+C Gram-positive bacteria) TaxID=2657482 RepID=UPI0009ABD745|nr:MULTISPECIES: dienelactone hydrolase family protein [unclassified Gordonia (in: high G+C Gram-positive bacteria)]MDF3282986.1 dienelactone hydrolase family protein [Gordonia sp. N1V]OPX10783.1 carboxymethylenebutenolidase [Gordonia sp. i37]